MKKQLWHFRLGIIGAMSVAGIVVTAPVANAAGVTAPVATTTGTYTGIMNLQEQPSDPATGVNGFLGIRYGQAPLGTLRWKRRRRQVPDRDQSSRELLATPARRDGQQPITRIACSSMSIRRPTSIRGPACRCSSGFTAARSSAAQGLTTTRR